LNFCKRTVAFAISVCSAAIIAVAVIIAIYDYLEWRLRYDLSLRAARQDFESTHGAIGATGTTGFWTLGVQFGDTEADVDRKLARAARRWPHLHDSRNHYRHGFTNDYEIIYGPRFTNIGGKVHRFYVERISVLFNDDGRAYGVRDDLYREDGANLYYEVDLRTNSITFVTGAGTSSTKTLRAEQNAGQALERKPELRPEEPAK
jgi:hypothetical protein